MLLKQNSLTNFNSPPSSPTPQAPPAESPAESSAPTTVVSEQIRPELSPPRQRRRVTFNEEVQVRVEHLACFSQIFRNLL
jgi:hypothetical protein